MNRFFMLLLVSIFSILYNKQSFSFEVGVGTHLQGFHGSPQEYIDLLKKYNVTSFRTDYHWNDVEKEKGIYTPPSNNLDELIELAVKNKITPVLILDYGNPLYTIDKPTTELQREAFSRYASWTVKRSGKDIASDQSIGSGEVMPHFRRAEGGLAEVIHRRQRADRGSRGHN